MAEFIINKEIETEKPTVEVTLTPENALPPGNHRFSLVVVDDSGNKSTADVVTVFVADTGAPNARLNAPTTVDSGKSFELDGSKSFDAGGGRIVRYLWTYLGPAER